MAYKFLSLVEENIQRHTNGGLLTSDVVKIVSNYKSMPSYKALSAQTREFIDLIAKTDKNIRVVDVKPMFPSHGTGNDQNRGTAFTAEIAIEMAPGYFDLQNKVTVPVDILQVDNEYINLPKTDQFKKKEKINHKPVSPEEDEETAVNNPYLQTMMSQDGTSLRRTETKLLNKNVRIPSMPAKGAASPEVKGFAGSYTHLSPNIKQ